MRQIYCLVGQNTPQISVLFLNIYVFLFLERVLLLDIYALTFVWLTGKIKTITYDKALLDSEIILFVSEDLKDVAI